MRCSRSSVSMNRRRASMTTACASLGVISPLLIATITAPSAGTRSAVVTIGGVSKVMARSRAFGTSLLCLAHQVGRLRHLRAVFGKLLYRLEAVGRVEGPDLLVDAL